MILSGKLKALLDVLLQLRESGLDELMFLGRKFSETVNLGDAVGLATRVSQIQDQKTRTHSKFNITREELYSLLLEQRTFHKGRYDDSFFTFQSPQEAVCEFGSGKSHAQRSRSSTILCLDDLITTVLNPLDQLFPLPSIANQSARLLCLAQQRHDCDAGMTTHDSNVRVLWIGTDYGREETRGTNDIEGGDAKETSGVKSTGFLEHGRDDGDGRIDGVGDDEDVGLGCGFGDGLGEVADDASIGLEQYISIGRRRPGMYITIVKATHIEEIVSGHLWGGKHQHKSKIEKVNETVSRY
jgi:hypothetical protein